ncbi:MAG: hypothetical protein GY794_00960, partial [bacterium]|nr:hypothetical protein [bacterium]
GGGAATSTVNLKAQGNDSQMTHAYVGKDAQVTANGGDFTLLAESHDTVVASSSAISGGAVEVFEARTNPTLARTTSVRVGPSATVTAEGDVQIQALKTTNLDATSSADAGGGVVVPQSIVDAEVGKSNVTTIGAFIDGANAQVTSRNGSVIFSAANSPDDVLKVNAQSRSYGGVTGQKSGASLKLNEKAQVVINSEAELSGSQTTLSATLAWDKVKVNSEAKTRSLVGIPDAESTLNGTVESSVDSTLPFTATTDNLKDDATVTFRKRYSVFWIRIPSKTKDGTNNITVIPTQLNASPLISEVGTDATAENIAIQGDLVTLDAKFTDEDILDTHTALVDWGDGQTTEEVLIDFNNGIFTLTATHVYQQGGIHPVRLFVTDSGGLVEDEATTAYVLGSGVVDGVLQIIGTQDADTIEITDSFGVPQVQSSIDGYFQPDILVDGILIQTFSGDDQVTISGDITSPTLIDGGDGVDTFESDRLLVIGPDGTVRVDGTDIIASNFEHFSTVGTIEGSDEADNITIFNDRVVVNGTEFLLGDEEDITIRSGAGDDEIKFFLDGASSSTSLHRITVEDSEGDDTYRFDASRVQIEIH